MVVPPNPREGGYSQSGRKSSPVLTINVEFHRWVFLHEGVAAQDGGTGRSGLLGNPPPPPPQAQTSFNGRANVCLTIVSRVPVA